MGHDHVLQQAMAARKTAELERDQAVEQVVAAFRSRARTWLTWVAFLIAERAAGRIDRVTVENIQAAVDDLADEVECEELLLSYDSVDSDDEDPGWGGAADVIDRATRRHVVDLGQSLRRMGLRPGPHFPEDSLVSRFVGDDGFSDLLTEWARAETSLRQAERRYRAAASLSDLGGLRRMWGQDAPAEDDDGGGGVLPL
jgi:hypothetical protein